MVGSQFDFPPSANSYSPITQHEGELKLPSGSFDVLYNGQTIQVQHDAGATIPVKFTKEDTNNGSVVYYGLRGTNTH